MSDAEAQPRESSAPAAGFPWAPAVLAFAGVVLAAWLWTRYSYAWAVTPRVLVEKAGFFSSRRQSWDRAYARLRGTARRWTEVTRRAGAVTEATTVWVGEPVEEEEGGGAGPGVPDIAHAVEVVMPRNEVAAPWRRGEWTGRVDLRLSLYGDPTLDATASRFAPESVAGLVVGAWGAFVFALHLRRWLAERKRCSSGAAAAPGPLPPPIQ